MRSKIFGSFLLISIIFITAAYSQAPAPKRTAVKAAPDEISS